MSNAKRKSSGGSDPPGEPTDAADRLARRLEGIGDKIDRLLDAIRHREQQVEVVVRELGKFPAAAENLVESVQVQVDLANNLDELLAGLGDRNDELAGMIRSVSETAAEQTEILDGVRSALSDRGRDEAALAEAMRGLTQALGHAPPRGTAHVQTVSALDQIRENMGKISVALVKATDHLVQIATQDRAENAERFQQLLQAAGRRGGDGGAGAPPELVEHVQEGYTNMTAALQAGLQKFTDVIEEFQLRQAELVRGLQDVAAPAGAVAAGAVAAGPGERQALARIAQDLEAVRQQSVMSVENTARLLGPVTVVSHDAVRLLRRQNRVLGWVLAILLTAMIGFAGLLAWRGRGTWFGRKAAVSPPSPAASRPAQRTRRKPAETQPSSTRPAAKPKTPP